MSCHLYSQQLLPVVAQNQERKQAIKGQGRNHTQINGGDRLRVVSEKCLPALRRRLRRSHHVFGNRRLSDFEPKHQEFAMDPSRQDSAPWPTQASRLRLRCQSWSGGSEFVCMTVSQASRSSGDRPCDRTPSASSSLGSIAATTFFVISSCRAKTSFAH